MEPIDTESSRPAYRQDYEALVNMNLHNHTTFSDGMFAPEVIVKKAAEYGLHFIGITDHYLTGKVRSMDNSLLERYIDAVEELKHRYAGKIRVLAGVEIDASAERTDFREIRYDLLNSLDYVLFEYVNDDLWGGMHLWELFPTINRIEIPCGLAHNDISRNFKEIDYDALLGVLGDYGIFVELSPSQRNSKFGKPYYRFAPDFFSKLAETEVKVSIGTDTHTKIAEIGAIGDAVQFIRERALQENLVTQVF